MPRTQGPTSDCSKNTGHNTSGFFKLEQRPGDSDAMPLEKNLQVGRIMRDAARGSSTLDVSCLIGLDVFASFDLGDLGCHDSSVVRNNTDTMIGSGQGFSTSLQIVCTPHSGHPGGLGRSHQ